MRSLYDHVSAAARRSGVGGNRIGAAGVPSNLLAQIKDQVLAEGGSSLQVDAAQTKLQQSWDSLVAASVDVTQIPEAALRFAQNSYTPSGVLSQVTDLIASGKSPTPGGIVNFGGSLVAAAAVAGGASLGVGAAIVGAVALVTALTDAFFSKPAPLVTLCGTDWTTHKPTIVIGCVGSDAGPVTPGSPLWRHFPSRANSHDGLWFDTGVAAHGGNWMTTVTIPPFWSMTAGPNPAPAIWIGSASTGMPHQTLIDLAFPAYNHIECEETYLPVINKNHDTLTDFFWAFHGAWRINAEYALNGLNSAADWQVLEHALSLWNQSHSDSSVAEMEPRDGYLLAAGAVCSGAPVPYASTLISTIIALDPQYEYLTADKQRLRVFTGPLKKIPDGGSGGNGGGLIASLPMPVKVIGGVAVGGLVIAALVAWSESKAVDAVIGSAWKKLKKAF